MLLEHRLSPVHLMLLVLLAGLILSLPANGLA